MKLFKIAIILLLTACNPCKYVAKHPECFPADTIQTSDSQSYYDSTYYADGAGFTIVTQVIKDTSCKEDIILLLEQINTANGLITDLKITNENDKAILTGRISKLVNAKKEIIIQREYVKVMNPINIENEKKLQELGVKLAKKTARVRVKNRLIITLSLVILMIVAGGILLKKLKIF